MLSIWRWRHRTNLNELGAKKRCDEMSPRQNDFDRRQPPTIRFVQARQNQVEVAEEAEVGGGQGVDGAEGTESVTMDNPRLLRRQMLHKDPLPPIRTDLFTL